MVKQVQTAIGAGAQAVDTPYGTATADAEGLLCVLNQGRRVLWIPEDADELKKRLPVCAHMKDAGHHGVDATLERLWGHCVWLSMEDDVKEMVRDYLFCADYDTGGLVPRPLSDTVHGTQVNAVVHFDVLYPGESEVAEGVDLRDGFVYVLVLMDDLSGYVWLRPAKSCTVNFVANELVSWCSAFGVPETWVSDNAQHFKNRC